VICLLENRKIDLQIRDEENDHKMTSSNGQTRPATHLDFAVLQGQGYFRASTLFYRRHHTWIIFLVWQ
jgi:hypothetical protein